MDGQAPANLQQFGLGPFSFYRASLYLRGFRATFRLLSGGTYICRLRIRTPAFCISRST